MKPKMIKVPNLWHRAEFINPHVLSSRLSRRGKGTGFSVLRVKLLSGKAWEEGNDSYWFLRQDSLDMKFCHLKKAEIITEAEFSFLLRSFLCFPEVTTWFIKFLPSFSSSLSHLTSRNRLLPKYVYHVVEKNPHRETLSKTRSLKLLSVWRSPGIAAVLLRVCCIHLYLKYFSLNQFFVISRSNN